MSRVLLACMLALCLSPPAFAQQAPTDDPVASAPIRLGAVGISPRFVVSNVGVDTNVFNSRDDPQRDFTSTISPGADLFLRTGRGLLTLSGGGDLVYFRKFDSQRSLGSHATGLYELRLNRIRPYVSAGTSTSRSRPGFEIDERARHYSTNFGAGTDVRLMSKTTARIEFRQADTRFARDAVFDGTALNRELNRTLRAVDVSWVQRLTALTTWVTRVSQETERFAFVSDRNSDSLRFSSGFELGRFALIRGSAFAGFRRLNAADGGTLPAFNGVTADVDVSYTMPTQTRLGAAVDRDVQYSYDIRTPYYVQTGWTATLTQRITGKWDAQLSGGRDRLAYQSNDPANRRNDFVGRFGGGIGYAVRDGVRAGFDVQSAYRSSQIRGREYGGVRAGFSMTYGS